MSLAERIEGVRRADPARGMLVVPERAVAWADLAAMGDLGRLFCLADPTFPLTRELGLIGWGGCPRARRNVGGANPRWRHDHKLDGRWQLTLWVMGGRAVCAVCGYAESLDELYARLGLEVRS